MKTTLTRLIALVFLVIGISSTAQNRVSVEAYNDDISYYLDLKAIASVFADSRNLEEFERRLNDYETGLSNLDLNNDGYIDYLRIIETSENKVHLLVIQAVLDRDVYQDVASIVIERDRRRHSTVQIIGDPYLYGYNYIIEPVFYRTPTIFSWFWASRYRSWSSPYYWGYYPTYYRYRNPLEIRLYVTHVHSYVNVRNEYRYADSRRNNYANSMYSRISRNDYGTRYPDRAFNKRNVDYKNKQEYSRSRTVDSNNNSRTSVGSQRNSNSNNNGTTYRRTSSESSTNPRTQTSSGRVNSENKSGDYKTGGRSTDNSNAATRTNNTRSSGYSTQSQQSRGTSDSKNSSSTRVNTQNTRDNQPKSTVNNRSSVDNSRNSNSSKSSVTNSRKSNTQSERREPSQSTRVETKQSSSSNSNSGIRSNPKSTTSSSTNSSNTRESNSRSSNSRSNSGSRK